MSKYSISVLVGLTGLFSSAAVLAQSSDSVAVKLGDAKLFPQLGIAYVLNSNFELVEADENSAQGYLLTPSVEVEVDNRNTLLRFAYAGDYMFYDEAQIDYDDHALSLVGIANLGVRRRAAATLSITKDHFDLGVEQTEGLGDVLDEQVEFIDTTLNASYTYGAEGAKGNITGGLLVRDRNYQNLKELTDGDSNTLIGPFARFSYRLGPDTRSVFELRYQTISYDNDSRDNDRLVGLVGFTLNERRKTSGEFKIGVTRVNYDDSDRDDRTVMVADGGLFWRPNGFDLFRFGYARQLDQFDSFDNSQEITDDISLNWKREWNARINTEIDLVQSLTNRDCPARSNTVLSADFVLSYSLRRWIDIVASYEADQRDSDDCAGGSSDEIDLDYSRVLSSVGVRMRL